MVHLRRTGIRFMFVLQVGVFEGREPLKLGFSNALHDCASRRLVCKPCNLQSKDVLLLALPKAIAYAVTIPTRLMQPVYISF